MRGGKQGQLTNVWIARHLPRSCVVNPIIHGLIPRPLRYEIKFWIHLHLQGLLENNIAKQCLQLSKEMADKNQSGLMGKN